MRSTMGSVVAVEGVEVAAVPGTAEEWGEVTFLARKDVKHAGELLGKHEAAALGGLLLITHGVDEAIGG
jgi:hypothetical protein